MAFTRRLTHAFGGGPSHSFSMTVDHWLVVGPIAAALTLAGMLIWFAG